MAYLFLDDSKHPHAGCVLATFVAFPDDPTPQIEQALTEHGLTPYVDEFKSSHRMADASNLQTLREALFDLLSPAKIGVAVAATEQRLADCCTSLLTKMLTHGSLAGEHQVYTDEGISRRLLRAYASLPSLETSAPPCRRGTRAWRLSLHAASKTIVKLSRSFRCRGITVDIARVRQPASRPDRGSDRVCQTKQLLHLHSPYMQLD